LGWGRGNIVSTSAQSDAASAKSARKPIPPPEPGLTPETLIERAIAMRDMIREDQDTADERGCPSPEIQELFVKNGFYRITQPRLFGGYEFDYTTFYRVMMEVARGNPGTGWCLALGASHAAVVAAHFPEKTQAEVFGEDGHFICPHRVGVPVQVKKVEDGYEIDGEWGYSSGAPYSTHFIGNAAVEEDGKQKGLGFIVPREDYEILDDWGGDSVLGMRASGSNTIRVKAFVPEHRVIASQPGLWSAGDISDGTIGTRLHGNPMYLGRLMGPYHASLVIPVIGAARAAMDEFELIAKARDVRHQPIGKWVNSPDVQRPFGEAMMKTDSAEALVIRAMDMYLEHCQRWAVDGTHFSSEDSVRLWGMLQNAGWLACDAVELIFRAGSSSASKKGQRIERYFRDVAMYRSHISSQQPTFAGGLARLHFGLPMDMFGI
jgi:3-hydroxy-9,10-secoandrosta-1,3,5(10)-triene-9,17-dione monooxygenase